MLKNTILIVEDEAIVAHDLAGKLRRLGYGVAGIASAGEEAVTLAAAERPQLVLMDISLDGPMDGIEAAEAIRRRCDIPVVFLTAHGDAATLARAKLTGPFGYVLKPFDERDLAAQIEMAIYRHQTDRELRQQREWLRVTLTSIGDAVIATDAAARVTFVNPVAEALTGWRAEEAAGQPIQGVFRIVNEQTGEPLEEPVARVLREGRAVELANHAALVTRDGRTVPIEDSAAPILDAAGQVIGVVLVFHDVTEKRRAEEDLRESVRRYELVLAGSKGGIWDWDVPRRKVEFSPRWKAMRGFADGEVSDAEEEWSRGIHPEDAPRVLAAVRAHFEGKTPVFAEEYRVRRKDDSWIWIADRGLAVRDAEGRVARMAGSEIDITDRRQAEEALRQSRENLDRAQEVGQMGWWRLDTQRNVLTWSDESHRIFGVPKGTQLTYETFLATIHPDDRQYVDTQWSAALRGEPYDIEHRIVAQGQVKWVREKAYLEIDDGGELLGGFGITQDITARKRAEEALAAAKAAAEAANQAKSQFLANMSHELRTPMNAILGMIDVALPKATDPTVLDCLQTAKGSADLLLTLLNDLLDSAKIESGKLELESAPFSLRRMLDQLTRVLATRASEKGLSFYCRLPEETPDALLGDRMRLQQVLLNLAGNAIKFTERGKVEIGLRASSRDGEACLEFAVRDTGIGIPVSVQERLFQPFAQADASMARRFGGTGLGLSISKNLVEMMGGRVWVESEMGVGSTFYFTVELPLAKEVPSDFDVPVVLPIAGRGQLRILLVEDNPANQKLAAYILRDRGHLVEIAGDGHEAISLTEQNRYDVILMDVQMPGMDGLEATAAIRKREAEHGLGSRDWGLEAGAAPLDPIPNPQFPTPSSRVPIIAMTAHAMKGDRERCLAAGMDGYLSKPVNAQEMIGLVESLGGKELEIGNCRLGIGEAELGGCDAPSQLQSPIPVFDPETALKRCFNKPHIVQQMIQSFLDEVDHLSQQMRAALEQGDLVAVGRLGHRVKGTVAYLGAEPAREAALGVERFYKAGGGTPSEAESAISALEHECTALKAALVRHVLAAYPAKEG